MWSPSGQEQTVEEIWDWYEEVSEAIAERREKIQTILGNNPSNVPEKFFYMSEKDIEYHFDVLQSDVDTYVCMALVASFEASLYVDTAKRIGKKCKQGISKDLKKVCKHNSIRPKLDKLINCWGDYCCSQEFAKFNEAYDFRNWIAHGRYWIPKLSRKSFDPTLIRVFIYELIECMGSYTTMNWK
jgi:hypothetical protein